MMYSSSLPKSDFFFAFLFFLSPISQEKDVCDQASMSAVYMQQRSERGDKWNLYLTHFFKAWHQNQGAKSGFWSRCDCGDGKNKNYSSSNSH